MFVVFKSKFKKCEIILKKFLVDLENDLEGGL